MIAFLATVKARVLLGSGFVFPELHAIDWKFALLGSDRGVVRTCLEAEGFVSLKHILIDVLDVVVI